MLPPREDLSIRCILITGAGEKAVCAGADLKERKTMPDERVPHFVRNIRALMDDVEAMPQPTIAVIGGFAFGGLWGLARRWPPTWALRRLPHRRTRMIR